MCIRDSPRGPTCRSEALLDFRLNVSSDVEPFWVPKRVPKRHPKSLKIRPPRPRAAQRPPGSLQDPPRGPPGSHFGLIWEPRNSFSSLSSVLFEVSARPAIRSKTLFEITCQKDCRDHCGTDAHNAQRLSGRFGAAGPLEIRLLSRPGSTEAVTEGT